MRRHQVPPPANGVRVSGPGASVTLTGSRCPARGPAKPEGNRGQERQLVLHTQFMLEPELDPRSPDSWARQALMQGWWDQGAVPTETSSPLPPPAIGAVCGPSWDSSHLRPFNSPFPLGYIIQGPTYLRERTLPLSHCRRRNFLLLGKQIHLQGHSSHREAQHHTDSTSFA